MAQDRVLLDKSLHFAARIVKLYRHLTKEKHEAVIAKQNRLHQHLEGTHEITASFLPDPSISGGQKRCHPKKPRFFLGFLALWGSKKYRFFP